VLFPNHEDDDEQVFIVIFGHLLYIMKMTASNRSLPSLAAHSHHEDDDEHLFIVIFGRLLRIMKTMTNNYSSLSLGACSA